MPDNTVARAIHYPEFVTANCTAPYYRLYAVSSGT